MEKFRSAYLKVDRSLKHIGDIDELSRTLSGDNHSIRIEVDAQTGSQVVSFSSDFLPPDIGLLVGDAVTNLRSALDHAYAAAIGLQDPTTGQVFFPIRDTRNGVLGSLQKGRKNGHNLTKRLYDCILDEVKPYDGENDEIVSLNRMSNQDKHRMMLGPVVI